MRFVLALVFCLIAAAAQAQPATQIYTGSPTQPVSSSNPLAVVATGTVPLPTGAATAANQTNGSQQTQVVGAVPLPTGAATAANQTNGSQVTQVAGTVSVTAAGAATAANQTNGNQIAQTTFTPTTYQGTITLTAATSTSLITANVAMASGTALPATFGRLMLVNVGANPGIVCWFGGTASASSNCETLAAGASDAVNLGNFATPPTLFSTAGTTFAFRN